jgi:hypothetical protein
MAPCVEFQSGTRFTRLTVIQRGDNTKHKKATWHCRCDCGNMLTVIGVHLTNGNTQSCGCLQREKASAAGDKQKLHGMKGTRTYVTWRDMKVRCHNPNSDGYARYGARGITVCDEWRESFVAFLSDMGERPDGMTLDRIDGSKGYSKANCRWATNKEQASNRLYLKPKGRPRRIH